jgi:hypothetical protein
MVRKVPINLAGLLTRFALGKCASSQPALHRAGAYSYSAEQWRLGSCRDLAKRSPARATSHFGAQTIRQLQQRLGLRAPGSRGRARDGLLPDEWWKPSLTRMLDIPRASIYHWIRQGLVRARQLVEPLHRWVVWADEAEQERLRAYRRRAIGDDLRRNWADAALAE